MLSRSFGLSVHGGDCRGWLHKPRNDMMYVVTVSQFLLVSVSQGLLVSQLVRSFGDQ